MHSSMYNVNNTYDAKHNHILHIQPKARVSIRAEEYIDKKTGARRAFISL